MADRASIPNTFLWRKTTLYHLLRGMRLKQWGFKNVFVFAGILFAQGHQVTNISSVVRVLTAFILFCFTSGAVYLINDIADIKKDRQHPLKRLRPLASGDLSPVTAVIAASVMIAICFVVAIWQTLAAPLGDLAWLWFGLTLLLYFVLQMAYTFALKNMVLIDIFIIAMGFVLRAFSGAAVINVHITPWWLLSVFFLALFLGLGKRRNELHDLQSEAVNHRAALKENSIIFLDYMLLIVITCTIIVYSLATFTSPLAAQMTYPFLMATIPVAVFALFRYLYLVIQMGYGGEPADLLLKDRSLQISMALCGFIILIVQIIRI